jgi:hypothetical protein
MAVAEPINNRGATLVVASISFTTAADPNNCDRSTANRAVRSMGRDTRRTEPGGAKTVAIPATCAANSRVGVTMNAQRSLLSVLCHSRSVMGSKYASVLPVIQSDRCTSCKKEGMRLRRGRVARHKHTDMCSYRFPWPRAKCKTIVAGQSMPVPLFEWQRVG